MMDFDRASQIARKVMEIKSDAINTPDQPLFRVTVTEETALSNGHRFVVLVEEARDAHANSGCWSRFARAMDELDDDIWWGPEAKTITPTMKVRA